MPNRLQYETSPYLLQHANNPVQWYAWGKQAFEKAQQENKIILISIGYAACHWCHVMEKESFENEEVAAIMNKHFINIKIDREERPDIDSIYMDAVQTMTGSGGWPLNVFLTPDKKPFYGGTYFPPQNLYNRASWTDVLLGVQKAWTERSHEILAQADNLTQHLLKLDFSAAIKSNADHIFTKQNCETIAKNILSKADATWGGFGVAPKFPQTFSIQYLLQYYFFSKDENALQHALLSINKMLEGGIYDQLQGGLARYSTDEEWLAPHFEKMLYDNALFINILADAYQITKQKKYADGIVQTINFIKEELMHNDGAFYAAIDADSEGEEGKFYVWTKYEIEQILQDDAELFCNYFNVTEQGNWEHKNILRIVEPVSAFLAKYSLDENVFTVKITKAKQKLLQYRCKRVKPLTDDKIILGWNALMITALCKAGAALQQKEYILMAENCFTVLQQNLVNKNLANEYHHTYKNEIVKYPAFLDDYAFLIQALINLQEVTSNQSYLHQAQKITEQIFTNFFDDESGFFFYTHKEQNDIIIRKKETYDGATASGNSVMAQNLFYLATVFNVEQYNSVAKNMLQKINQAIVKHPGSFAVWASSILFQSVGVKEIAIIGSNATIFLDEILSNYIPNKIIQASTTINPSFALLNHTSSGNNTFVYVCEQYRCTKPINNPKVVLQNLQQNNKFA